MTPVAAPAHAGLEASNVHVKPTARVSARFPCLMNLPSSLLPLSPSKSNSTYFIYPGLGTIQRHYSARVARSTKMLSSLFYRICVFCINLVFPPAAVMIVAGLGMDVVVNCILLLLGVIPAHVHGFYLSFTYSHRRHKVRQRRQARSNCIPLFFLSFARLTSLAPPTGEERQVPRRPETARLLGQRHQRRRQRAGGGQVVSRAVRGRGTREV